MRHSLTERFLILLTKVIGGLLIFCDIVERILQEWHEKTVIRGKQLKELSKVMVQLQVDIEELRQVMEEWSSHEGSDSGH